MLFVRMNVFVVVFFFLFFFVFCLRFCVCGLSRVDSGTPGGFSNDGNGGAGPQQSGGVTLSLSAADATPAGSPDPSSLTVLQPANNNQNNGTVYAASAPTMLPGFTTHYAATGKSTHSSLSRSARCSRATKPYCWRSVLCRSFLFHLSTSPFIPVSGHHPSLKIEG